MATTMTLLQLRDATRQRADMVGSTFVSDAELTSYINQSAFELYDILVSAYGEDYYTATPSTFVTDGTNDKYALPATFYKLLGVDLQLSSSPASWVTLRPFTFSERNRYAVPNFQSFYGFTNLRYRILGDQLWLTPLPSAGQTVRLYYVPRMTTLSLDADTLEGVSGWTEYVITDAAIKCLQKEESDPSVLMAQKQALLDRIATQAANRDAGNAARVADVVGSGPFFGSTTTDGSWGY